MIDCNAHLYLVAQRGSVAFQATFCCVCDNLLFYDGFLKKPKHAVIIFGQDIVVVFKYTCKYEECKFTVQIKLCLGCEFIFFLCISQ
jgi:hypothetical protein